MALSDLVVDADGILFSEAIEAEGELAFANACAGLEGLVWKRRGSLYRSGASKSWLKTKNPAFVMTRMLPRVWGAARYRAFAFARQLRCPDCALV